MKFRIHILLIAIGTIACKKSLIPHKQELQLTWEENFDRIDYSVWSKIPRGYSPWNKYMSDHDECYAIRDGKLVLKGIINPDLTKDTATYLTGGLYTKDKLDFGLGRLEIRAKLGSAQGAWPAFWMLASGRRYPEGGEIDIMEHLNHDDFAYQTVHSKYTIDLGIKDNPKHYNTGKIKVDDFNVYALEKYADSLVFYINDQKTFAYPRLKDGHKDQFPFAEGSHYLLLDMQLGGDWVGKINPEELPVEMEIDWVRFYKFE